MMSYFNKKVMRSTIIGICLLFVSLLLTGICGISDLIDGGSVTLGGRTLDYGFKAGLSNYFTLFWFPHATGFFGIVLIFVALTITITLVVLSIKKNKKILILPSVLLGASIAFLPFILIVVIPCLQYGGIRAAGVIMMAGVTGLVLFAIYFFAMPVAKLLREGLNLLNKAGGQSPRASAGLSEDEVRTIVEEYLAEHVEEKHPDGAVVAAPVEEEPAEEPAEEEAPVEEEPTEEPAEEEAPVEEEPAEEEADDEGDEEGDEEGEADDGAPVGLNIKGKRRRASFETRLKNSEFDIRHKYYDLRDYIKWYGLRNRVSIPGDTFSYKRQRYAFVTIVGKHIRLYINLNPADYAESTIPVEAATAKKYEDLPSLLRIKSDLSYRRAKKLVDDLMAKIGIEKPDEDEPKETQNQD